MRIFPLGENALTVEFGDVISHELNSRALSLADYVEQNPFPGYVESVPAYASATFFYDLTKVRNGFPDSASAFESVKALIEAELPEINSSEHKPGRNIEIPMSFDPEHALDLREIADAKGLSSDELIDIFTAQTYSVYMIGFLPGFAYMGKVDERIAVPRRSSPRLKVPKGSVGIGGKQTGIYPLESPGGWQIIGKTEMEMFTPEGETPCPLKPGDNVRFVRA